MSGMCIVGYPSQDVTKRRYVGINAARSNGL